MKFAGLDDNALSDFLKEFKEKLNERKLAKLKELWQYNLEPITDKAYITSKQHMLDGLNDGVYSSGLEFVKNLNDDPNAKYQCVSEHLSEQDFIEIAKLFFRENIDPPAIFAGANLLVSGLTKPSFLIRHPVVLDIKKSNTIIIDRQLSQNEGEINSAYKRLLLDFFGGVKEDESKRIKAESGVFERHNTLIFNSGRSRDGKVRDYDFHTLSSFHHYALKNPGLDYYFVPICITLERCIEDSSFDIQNLIKNSRLPLIEKWSEKYNWAKNANETWIKQTGKWGAVADILSFLVFYIRNQPRGEIYLDFGEPINVADFKKNEKPQLLNLLTERINNNVRVTPTSLVSLILKEHPKNYISRSTMLKKIHVARQSIPSNLLLSNYLLDNRNDEEVLDRATMFLNEKRLFKAMPYVPLVSTYYIRRKSFLTEYYANRITHHNIQL